MPLSGEGDVIGGEDDEETVGPIALAAKQSILQAIAFIMPQENAEGSLYRLGLEHGDFGTHNITTTFDSDGEPLVTSLFDWETGWIGTALFCQSLWWLLVLSTSSQTKMADLL